MKKLAISRMLPMAFICLFVSCTLEHNATPSPEIEDEIDLNLSLQTDWNLADAILNLINNERTSEGLTTLQKDSSYASAYAVEHTLYMIEMGTINHDYFEQRAARLKQRGAQFVGENVANGYTDAQGVFDGWLNSSSHRDVLLGNYSHVGFGVLQNSEGIYFYTLLFYKG